MSLDQVQEPTWGSTPKLIKILVRENKLAQIINGCLVVRFQCFKNHTFPKRKT